MQLFSLIFIPFVFGILSMLSERLSSSIPRWIALFAMCITLGIVLFLFFNLNVLSFHVLSDGELSRWQIEYFFSWIPRFGINIHLALDGLSFFMVILSGILGILAVLCSWQEIKYHQGFFYLNLLWVLSGVIGVFLAIDLFLFFCFWEIMLVPMYFLIAIWGHQSLQNGITRVYAATKFFIYTQASGLLMLLSIIGLVLVHYNSHGIWTFDYNDLMYTSMSNSLEYVLMLGFFLAFAVKLPIVPFHGWLPDAHTLAPTAGSVDLAGILLKTAAYGLLRFNVSLFPESSKQFAVFVMLFGLVGIFYGALMAFSQTDIKRFVAYTSISHMGFILIAIYSGTELSYYGAIIQMIAHGLSSSGMFILCGQLYERLRTRDIRDMGGLWSRLDLIPAFFLFFIVSMLGLPGTGNFVGEIIVLFGVFQVFPLVAILATFGLVFSSVYSLILMYRVHYGPLKFSKLLLPYMLVREQFIIVILLLLLLFVGLSPQRIIDCLSTSIANIQNRFNVDSCSIFSIISRL